MVGAGGVRGSDTEEAIGTFDRGLTSGVFDGYVGGVCGGVLLGSVGFIVGYLSIRCFLQVTISIIKWDSLYSNPEITVWLVVHGRLFVAPR